MMFELSQLQWEECVCDGCSSQEYQTILEGPDRSEGLPGTFRIVQCANCGLLRQNPRLVWDSLKLYYPENYHAYTPMIREEKHWWRRLDRRYGQWKRLQSIERFKRGGRLLEVGCGTGVFLEEVMRSGRWEAVGIEPSTESAAYVRNALNIPVYEQLLPEVNLEAHSFDVIVLWNVVEHFYYPIRDLRLAHRLLKPDGLLVFSLPNLESLDAKIFGRYWAGWELPRHLYLFPRQQLRGALDKIGFLLIDERCVTGSHGGWRMSLEFWSQSWEEKYPKIKSLLLKVYQSWLMRILLLLPLFIQDRLKASTLIVYFAQKAYPSEHQIPKIDDLV
jgi:SAM-dependent methyltransferase